MHMHARAHRPTNAMQRDVRVRVRVCRSIKPFDVAELPTHLKGCSTPKKKEDYKEDVQRGVEASRLSR